MASSASIAPYSVPYQPRKCVGIHEALEKLNLLPAPGIEDVTQVKLFNAFCPPATEICSKEACDLSSSNQSESWGIFWERVILFFLVDKNTEAIGSHLRVIMGTSLEIKQIWWRAEQRNWIKLGPRCHHFTAGVSLTWRSISRPFNNINH